MEWLKYVLIFIPSYVVLQRLTESFYCQSVEIRVVLNNKTFLMLLPELLMCVMLCYLSF